jgi:hypothetical protein
MPYARNVDVNNSTEHINSSEANSRLAYQEIQHLVWSQIFRLCCLSSARLIQSITTSRSIEDSF